MNLYCTVVKKWAIDIVANSLRQPSPVSSIIFESVSHGSFLRRAPSLKGMLRKSAVAFGISGVVGYVIDISLMRLHLMELAESGSDRQPTGRMVVFSNAVVLQSNAGFTKQIPGTNFVWQEMRFTLAPDSDYRLAERRLSEAIEEIYNDYRESIEHQHRAMERTLNLAVEVPRPTSRLRLSDQGLEIVLRYPTGAQHAAEIADRVSRRLLEALQRAPKLRLVGNGTPNIQPITQPLASDGQPNQAPVL